VGAGIARVLCEQQLDGPEEQDKAAIFVGSDYDDLSPSYLIKRMRVVEL